MGLSLTNMLLIITLINRNYSALANSQTLLLIVAHIEPSQFSLAVAW
jgi:hypothetical protein